MDCLINTFGGGDDLVHVFNAVGRIFVSDSEYFTPVGKYAMGLGATWAATKAIFKADLRDFSFNWLFPSLLAFIFLFSPKSTVWIKDEVTMSAPVKIDNIPFGIAFFSSVSSGMSYAISEMIEKHLLPVDGLSISKTGLLFGAKLVGKIRDVQIQDPILLRNTKEYMRQCYLKPYILGDIAGKKGAAQAANDIIDFLEKNPANNFGIYYHDELGGGHAFKTCKQATPLIKQALTKELNGSLLARFASAIGMSGDNQDQLKARLKLTTGEALSFLKKDQADLHSWMRQAMLLNASRESYDDWREKHSLKRLYPQLISMNATRGMFQQSISWMTAGEIAASNMPILQASFFAVIVCLIFIVFPMSMLPGGYSVLKLWITLMIWVNSWPVFFTIIHCLGLNSLAKKSAMLGDSGINILSQGGFSEIALNSYATYQLFAASVPVLAYAVLKACTHATTSLVGSFSPMGVAAGIGANSADNNLNIDNISHGGRSISQQQYAPSLSIGGGVVDDGGMRVITTGQGEQIINQPVDNLPTNYRMASTMSDSIQTQISSQQSQMTSLTNRQSDLASLENRQMLDLAEKFSRGEASIDGISLSEQESMRTALSRGFDARNGTSYREGKENSTNSSANVGFELAGSGVKTGVSATNSDSSSKEMSAAEQKAFNESLEKVKYAQRSNNISATNEEVKSLTKGLSRNYSEQQSVGQEIARTAQTIQSLQQSKSYVESNAATIDRNFNDAVLQHIVNAHPEINSKEQAARWISSHQSEADAVAKEMMSIDGGLPQKNWENSYNDGRELAAIDSHVDNMPTGSKNSLKNQYDIEAKRLEDRAVAQDVTGQEKRLSDTIKDTINSAKIIYNNDTGQLLHNRLSEGEREKAKNIKTATLPEMINDRQKLENYHQNTPNSTVFRTVGEADKRITEFTEGGAEIIEKLKK